METASLSFSLPLPLSLSPPPPLYSLVNEMGVLFLAGPVVPCLETRSMIESMRARSVPRSRSYTDLRLPSRLFLLLLVAPAAPEGKSTLSPIASRIDRRVPSSASS